MANEMKISENLHKIDTNDLGEFIWWCAHLGVGPELLLSIIGRVGNSIEKIREQLDKRHQKSALSIILPPFKYIQRPN